MLNRNVSAVVLAAGNSSRLNSWKPGAILNGRSILYYSLQTLSSVTQDIVVVGGYNFNKLEELANGISFELNISVKCIYNPVFETGMFSSVRAGLQNTINEYVFITLSDMPFVKKETYMKLLEMRSELMDVIYPVNQLPSRLKKGHPILINKLVKNSILNTPGDMILRDVLKEFRSNICVVDDDGINFDIDTEEDLLKAKRLLTLQEKNQDNLL